jgi:sugar phosphate isomerase/epimerase
MIWAYCVPFYWGFQQLELDDNPVMAGLKFNQRYGLQGFTVNVNGFAEMDEGEQSRILAYINEHEMYLFPMVGYKYVTASEEESRAEEETTLKNMQRWIPEMRAVSTFTAGGHTGHRYDREIPLARRIELLSERIAPLASLAQELGTPMGINNQGDYYISDLVEVCKRTPGLGVYLDTANVFWVGEKALPAYEEAAPYLVGTHWRDEYVHPGQTKPQRLELTGAVLGAGDVPLRQCFEIIKAKAPDTKNLVMQLEMIKPADMDEFECLDKSLEFVRELMQEDNKER